MVIMVIVVKKLAFKVTSELRVLRLYNLGAIIFKIRNKTKIIIKI